MFLYMFYVNVLVTQSQRLVLTSVDLITTGVNPAGDARDTYPPIFWLEGTTMMGISPPILLCTFGYSRPILVVLAQ